ncbi:hypothetical protein C0J52_00062 [Blattella germanica]|nr:hypothetical protein C0J52_00062 [Blattella germanica]
METNFSGDMAAFFSSVEWDSMAEYEKRRVFNILENHRMMVSFGLAPKKPEFMCLNINKRKQEEDDSCKEIKRYKFVPPFKKKGDGPTVEDNNNNNDNAEIQEESSDKGNRYCRKSKLSEKTMLTTTRRASQRRFSNKVSLI